jgi:hypothetical protein
VETTARLTDANADADVDADADTDDDDEYADNDGAPDAESSADQCFCGIRSKAADDAARKADKNGEHKRNPLGLQIEGRRRIPLFDTRLDHSGHCINGGLHRIRNPTLWVGTYDSVVADKPHTLDHRSGFAETAQH